MGVTHINEGVSTAVDSHVAVSQFSPMKSKSKRQSNAHLMVPNV